ncbi:MAG TPA: AAA family ATPase [Acidobacteriota bacterium]|nr:AAA family ATPase [Acidobacteriota bacterium]
MYLSQVRLWNFRKFGSEPEGLDLGSPDVTVPLSKGLNVLIGENDSGKTAVIDAIKLVLDTHSSEWVRLNTEDFFRSSTRLRIECRFDDFTDDEAKHFTEWLGMEGEGDDAVPYLRVILDASRQGDRILPFDIRAGLDEEGYRLTAEARDYLKTTYLRPLRDAKYELMPRKHSRLSQILLGHEAFKDKEDSHWLITEGYRTLSEGIAKYFKEAKAGDKKGKELRDKLEEYLEQFFGERKSAVFSPADKKLRDILEILKLALEEEYLGLGSQNLLFIATELLNLERTNWTGLRLGLIEELEAHLHPQAQMKVISYLQALTERTDSRVQLVLTTHSPNLGSKVKLDNLITCSNGSVFPMGSDPLGVSYTQLEKSDHEFLERFLDVTKANLFFARGVILVEGWAEELLLPALARQIGCDLTRHGVSVVNVAGTAFLRYSRIFRRKDGTPMGIPVAIITDLDVSPAEEADRDSESTKTNAEAARQKKQREYDGDTVKTFVSPHWTLEYCLALSKELKEVFYASVREIHSRIGDKAMLDEVVKKLENHSLRKAEIAQILAATLSDTPIEKKALEIDPNIQYLLDAIKYATGTDNDN